MVPSLPDRDKRHRTGPCLSNHCTWPGSDRVLRDSKRMHPWCQSFSSNPPGLSVRGSPGAVRGLVSTAALHSKREGTWDRTEPRHCGYWCNRPVVL